MIGFDTYRRIHKALDLIASGAVDELEPGHYDLDEGIYVNVMEIETKDSGIFESHHQYADIHYPMIGSEQIELADEAGMAVTEAYDAEKDCVFGTAAGERYVIRTKQPFVVMPGEAHVPGLRDGECRKVRKAVVKVPV